MNISKSISSLSSWSSSLSNWSMDQQQFNQLQQFHQNQSQSQSLLNVQYYQPKSVSVTTVNQSEQMIEHGQQEQQQHGSQVYWPLQFKRPIQGIHGITQQSKTKSYVNHAPMIIQPLSFFSGPGLILTPVYSRKVFVGGLPPDIDENEIVFHFRRFGPLLVDWPHKSESKSSFPPKGYAFLIFERETSVQELVNKCTVDKDKYYTNISSPSIRDKQIQIRPWCLNDSDFIYDTSHSIDARKTIFVGGVPRPLKAIELAMIMNRLYGGVCYAGIDIDPELKYPKGAARVSFNNQNSFVSAISARFVQLQHGDIDKRAEVKPYVLDDQSCDICAGIHCNGKNAPFFCANVTCLQYFCEQCWASTHSQQGREYHKPLVKEGADRPRIIPFKWC